jgi:prefoldin alpha subunit|eukprot:scaffold11116_cov246-Chaetoceros_neogracile.AAC.1
MRRNQEQEQGPTQEELREKLNEYINFIDHTLHPQLKVAISQREETESEMREYQELQHNLELFKDGKMKDVTMVDLGHKLMYCQAKITDCNHVFVSIGMGFHAELTIDEALVYIKRRMNFLNREKLSKRVDKARDIAAHMEKSLEILDSLGDEIKSMGASG